MWRCFDGFISVTFLASTHTQTRRQELAASRRGAPRRRALTKRQIGQPSEALRLWRPANLSVPIHHLNRTRRRLAHWPSSQRRAKERERFQRFDKGISQMAARSQPGNSSGRRNHKFSSCSSGDVVWPLGCCSTAVWLPLLLLLLLLHNTLFIQHNRKSRGD